MIPSNKNHHVSLLQFLVLLLGIGLTSVMMYRWINEGTSQFFSLLLRFRGKFLSEAYFLVIGIVILFFGIFDIFKSQKS